jgi:hypothetical protein
MQNQINMGDQNTQQVGQNSVNQPAIEPAKPKRNYVLIGAVILACLLVFGFGGYYLGKQSSKPKLTSSEQKNQVVSSPTSTVVVPTLTEESKVTQPAANCVSTFTSKLLKLIFKYDSCVWKLSENLVTPEAGVYSTITAKHNSNHQVIIKANTMGMGGGYPGCYQVNGISLLDGNIVRVQMVKNPMGDSPKYYYYLNAKNDYAIKGYTGKFGDEKFKEYFTFLNPDVFPNTNMCWRSDGINSVEIKQPTAGQTESYQINKDIVASIEEENISDTEFLKAADALVVSVYSSLTQ